MMVGSSGEVTFFPSDDNIIGVLRDMPVSMNTELSELGQLRI